MAAHGACGVFSTAGGYRVKAPFRTRSSLHIQRPARGAQPADLHCLRCRSGVAPLRPNKGVAETSQCTAPTSSYAQQTEREPLHMQQQGSTHSFKQDALQDRKEVADKLIQLFQSKPRDDWRKLMAYSKQWPKLAPHVLERLEERVRTHSKAGEAGEASELSGFRKQLRNVHEEQQRYATLVQEFLDTEFDAWEGIVGLRREEMQSGFFEYLQLRIRVAGEDEIARGEMVTLATRVAALVDAYDALQADQRALDAAAATFSQLLQSESLEEADARIDHLADTGRLDAGLLLTMAKAYAGTRESSYNKEDVKEVMAHLYFKAKESFARQQPPVLRILKMLLAVEDPKELREDLERAFTPGEDLETPEHDFLSTTPKELLKTIQAVLDAYEGSKGKFNQAGEAASLMNPVVIERMEKIKFQVEKHWL